MTAFTSIRAAQQRTMSRKESGHYMLPSPLKIPPHGAAFHLLSTPTAQARTPDLFTVVFESWFWCVCFPWWSRPCFPTVIRAYVSFVPALCSTQGTRAPHSQRLKTVRSVWLPYLPGASVCVLCRACAQLWSTLLDSLDRSQAPLSMGSPRQGHWSGLPFPPPGIPPPSWPRDWTHIFHVSCIAGRFFNCRATGEAQNEFLQMKIYAALRTGS